ncbi:carbohydrate binding domain-containing protein [Hymenobacter lapidiphilus]|uniref:Carbohydrate binding domain-containing protein n=1 Tax=Hymenobacter lapidiphilus TaxID=2608003 RepID=A0A7Y7U6B8_9BACT|nr:carbohydrate binding domain-containing protein [Hymenobacter lapidiphilus]NVO31604.1 carbohydrate binding domain-containing protein [Hymenobacter lapidiphilus]
MRLLPFFTLLLTAAATSLLAGCSNSDTTTYGENVIARNDFEALEGWIPAAPSLTTVKAHSGRYSIKVDNGVEYALGYISPLAKVSATRLKKLDVSAWAMIMDKDATASLVVEVRNPADDTQRIFWEALDIGKEVKAVNKWVEVKRTFILPETIEPTYELRVYMWRGGASAPVFLDDIIIARGE